MVSRELRRRRGRVGGRIEVDGDEDRAAVVYAVDQRLASVVRLLLQHRRPLARGGEGGALTFLISPRPIRI
jgi:hypothetical protein